MRFAGRVAAAIEVLDEVLTRHRPASEALKDWGKAHRFAGSTDRHAIGTLIYDGLRNRNSAAARVGSDTARGLILGTLRNQWQMDAENISALSAEQHGPGALTLAELGALKLAVPKQLPAHVAGDFPEWLTPAFHALFGEAAAQEGAALAKRAPIDLRVNTLKATVPQVLEALSRFGAVAGPLSPLSVRVASPAPDQKHVNLEVEASHGMGWFEIQDTASQIAALLSGVVAGESVADICAGAGGKTLALAALMKNTGRLIAHDRDKRRLRPIFERMTRAGASCIEVVAAEDNHKLDTYGGFDCVVIDAPCSGSGSWRRKPDAKWKLTPKVLEMRIADQQDVLRRGAQLVRPGGRLVYITCSIFADENTEQVNSFLGSNPGFKIIPYTAQWARTIGGVPPKSADGSAESLLLTPHQHDVDGFFIAVMRRVN